MFKLKSTLSAEEKATHLQEIKKMTEQLKAELPIIIQSTLGINAPSADQTNYDVVITCDFANIADLNTYQVAPLHQSFGQYIAQIRESRACVDFEI
jgi:Stress responsive A/B Barrel Domain.